MNSAHQDASNGIHMYPGPNISILDSAHMTCVNSFSLSHDEKLKKFENI